MQGFGLGQHPQYAPLPPAAGGPLDPSAYAAAAGGAPMGGTDPAQLQQLVQLLGAKMLPKQTAVVECPKSMVGRVIGKGGETIKSLQQYTGAMIQIDQSTDPTRVTIAGSPQSLQLAVSMVNDIVRGTFKGFAMLRQIALSASQPGMPGYGQPQPVYVQGYGFVPPSQVYSPEDPLGAAGLGAPGLGAPAMGAMGAPAVGAPAGMLRPAQPTAPLTPPMTPLRAGPGAPGMPGGLAPELAALLGQQQGMGMAAPPMGSQDALLGQLLSQMASQAPQQQPQFAGMQQAQAAPHAGEADPAAIQALLAQAGLLGAGGLQQGLGAASAPAPIPASAGSAYAPSTGAGSVAAPLSTGTASPVPSLSAPMAAAPLFAGAAGLQGPPSGRGAGSYLGTSPTATHSSADTGSGRTSPAGGLASANPALITRRPGSDTGSPLGRYGAVGSPSSQGAASSIGAAAEEALAAKMGAISVASRQLSPPAGPPAGPAAASVTVDAGGAGVLPPGWAKVTDGQGLVYYVNHVTQESSLTRPTASAQGQAAM